MKEETNMGLIETIGCGIVLGGLLSGVITGDIILSLIIIISGLVIAISAISYREHQEQKRISNILRRYPPYGY